MFCNKTMKLQLHRLKLGEIETARALRQKYIVLSHEVYFSFD